MKKSILMALAAVAMLASCSKENVELNDKTGPVALSVKIDMSKFATRGGDAPVVDLPEWDNLLLIVTDNADAFVEQKTISKADFDALTGGTVNLIEKSANVKLIGGKVTAYITTKDNEWGVMSAAIASSNLPVLAKDQLDINQWQSTGKIKDQIAGKFVNIPYYGQSAAIAKTGMTSDGRVKLEAAVSLTPELGRIQVLNAPKVGGEKNDVTVTSLTISNIYINKISTNSKVEDIRTINNDANVDPTTWKANFYGTDKALAGMCDVATDKGYQIFDANTPHVIVEISYKLTPKNGTEGAAITGYLTIQNFTYTEGGTDFTSADLKVNKGKIYNIDLSKLTPSFDQIGEDPYDNTVWHDLIATVTIVPWTKIEVTPEL